MAMRSHQLTLLRLSLALNVSLLFTCAVWYAQGTVSAPASAPASVPASAPASAPPPPPPPSSSRTAPVSAATGLVTTAGGEGLAPAEGAPEPLAVRRLPENATAAPVLPHCPLHALQRCQSPPRRAYTAMRGARYWVMYNLALGERQFACDESVTYTTHGDFTFVDNLGPLVRRWRGPVSFGLYAPGADFVTSIESVAYLRQCGEPLVAQLVTFHVVYDVDKVPLNITATVGLLRATVDCAQPPPWQGVASFRKAKRLTYPVNVVRNVARETVMTHFVLPSDVELYPSVALVADFLALIRRNPAVLCQSRPKVFVLSIFEVNKAATPPTHKDQLTSMLKNGSAIPFHKRMCARCHTIPKAKEWTFTSETRRLSVFYVGKRYAPHAMWEPIYICTNDEPGYDERLTWEGKMDKMGQGYAMCVQDYDFMILNNAFLVHKPGIKFYKPDKWRDALVAKQRRFVINAARVELDRIYGTRKGCELK